MKQKFSFLTDIIAEKVKDTNEKIQALYECVEKSKSEIIQELLTVNESIQVLDNNVKKLQSDIGESKIIAQENIEEFKNRLMENSGDIKETIRSVIAKVEQIDKAGLEREKQLKDVLLTKSEIITSEIECVKSLIQLLTANEGDIKEIIRSVIAKIEQIDKAGLEREKQFGDVLLTKSEMITSEIEDIKSLVKLLAINELVDEIDISAT